MKKILIAIIILIPILMSGCNNDKNEDAKASGDTSKADSIEITKMNDADESIEGAQIQDTASLRKGLITLMDSIKSHNPQNFNLTVPEEGKNLNRNCIGVPTNRDGLSGLKTVITMFSGNKDAGISVPGFGSVKLGKSEINYNIYYIESKLVHCSDTTLVYACGYSLHLLVKKMKKSLDLAKLPSVAASVQLENNKTSVYYSLETHGLTGIILVKFFKPVVNKPFDVEGFGIMQSSIDGIHGILGDESLSKKVRFSPVAIGFVKPEDLER